MESLFLNTELTKILVSSLVTLVGGILSWIIKYKYSEYRTRKTDRILNQSKLVQTILEHQLETYGCQRAFIMQRHNGGKFKSGKPMNKLSTTYEALEEGISREFKEYQNLPISLYTRFIEQVNKHEAMYSVVDDIEDILTRAFFSLRGAKSAIVFPIKQGSELLGIVGFEWTHKMHSMDNDKDDLKEDGVILGETLSKLL